MTVEEDQKRALKCVDILRRLDYVDSKRIAAYGNSMGGYVTIRLAADASAGIKAAAITASGINDEPGTFAPTSADAGKVRIPLLMLHGGADNVIAPERSLALQKVLEANKVSNVRFVYPGQGHNVHNLMKDDVYGRLRAWFHRCGVLSDR